MSDMMKLFEAARRVSVPIVAIRTADQNGTVDALRGAAAAKGGPALPLVQWDAARGLAGVNKEGEAALASAKVKSDETIGFVEGMLAARLLPRGTVVVALNAHRQVWSSEPMQTAAAVQAVANLRDDFKKSFRMLVMLGPLFQAPAELEHDIVVLDHALPSPEELAVLVEELHNSVKPPLAVPKGADMARATEALSGLSSFAAEQVTAMSLTQSGLDYDALWERKRVTIEQTRGLSVWRGGERFADLVGLESVKAKLLARKTARTPVGVVVFIDEIDKALANVESDTSGVRMDQFRTLLTEMENNEWRGMVLVGVPGGGKSAVAKAFGNEAGVPTIALDLGGMESKFVGESEAYLRHAVGIIKAVGRGHAYFIATSNNASVMRPELQRRFTDGMFFFDVMTDAERAAAWAFYEKKYQLPKQKRPDDDGWTGAEIRNCCREAWDTRTTLVDAARFIIPMARSRAKAIEELRQHANGTFLDATRPGAYRYSAEPMKEQLRAIELPPEAIPSVVSAVRNVGTLAKES